jgi:hypothetical protein
MKNTYDENVVMSIVITASYECKRTWHTIFHCTDESLCGSANKLYEHKLAVATMPSNNNKEAAGFLPVYHNMQAHISLQEVQWHHQAEVMRRV